MAGSVNKVILVGNVGRDPEIKRMPSGDAIVNFSIATSETWRDKQTGERKEKTEWHRIVIFNEGLAKIAEQYVRKGSKVYLEGQLQTREWQDKDGTKRSTTEVVLQRYRGEMTLLDGRGDGASSGGRDAMEDGGSSGAVGYDRGGGGDRGGYDRGGASRSAAPRSSGGAPRPTDMDDDIPF